ncbi:unnamed protein product [marine sediment metagenome]|uniref:Pentapeptide repeat-containing protein n=1 Tax=marine sediment metagenome TaxID=412755 RepID=X0X8F2_9ZZZZ
MTQGEVETGQYQVSLVVYESLAMMTPKGKTDTVLRLIEEHPEGRLELPERDGVRADLRKVDLSRDTLKAKLVPKLETPPWWFAYFEGARLVGARLQGANLENANLQGAIMNSANLQNANLGSANLQDAHLTLANLQGAILADTNLQGADLKYADLQDTRQWWGC